MMSIFLSLKKKIVKNSCEGILAKKYLSKFTFTLRIRVIKLKAHLTPIKRENGP